jgi:ribonuclease VapC
MYVDASAIVAILNREPEAAALKAAFDANSAKAFVSPLTIFEATISLARAKVFARNKNQKPSRADIDAAHKVVRAFLEANDVKEIPVLADIGRLAIETAATYGKAVGHPADLPDSSVAARGSLARMRFTPMRRRPASSSTRTSPRLPLKQSRSTSLARLSRWQPWILALSPRASSGFQANPAAIP